MPLEARKYFFDMLAACSSIESFTQDLTLVDYQATPLVQSAVERKFLVIGEAMNQLRVRHPDLAGRIPDHRDIINFRNVIVHGYDQVDDQVVWGVVKRKLPALKQSLLEILEHLE